MRFGFLLLILVFAAGDASADRLAPVAKGDFRAPRFSPDGQRILVTGPRMRGLWLIDVTSGSTRLLVDEARSGLSGAFLADGRVTYVGKRAGVDRNLAVDDHGGEQAIAKPDVLAFAKSDRVFVHHNGGLVQVGTGDRFFDPRMSPDMSKLAFVGLASGIYVYDLKTRKTEYVGPGTSPSWSPDSRSLVYENTEDDGHIMTGSELWTWSASLGAAQLTDTGSILERRPTWSPDGGAIAFDDDQGGIYILSMEGAR